MTPLFPALTPYLTGHLPVSGDHCLYYEQSGAADGTPVIFIHGGPGSGAAPQHRRYFNPSKWKIILYDQRGCGRSSPLFSLRNNTTQDLIEDLEALRVHLGVERWAVFGPSWGSTLALAYAQAHPDRVSALVIEGVLLGTRAEMDWFHAPNGAGAVHPDALARLMADVPRAYQNPIDFQQWALEHMQNEIDQGRPHLVNLGSKTISLDALRQSMIYRWTEFEETLSWLDKSPDELQEAYALKGVDWLTSHSLLEAWYFVNDCFLEPGQILDGAHRLTMPVHIVQSRYDMVCPGQAALSLNQAVPHAQMSWIEQSGHIMTSPVHREIRAIFESLQDKV